MRRVCLLSGVERFPLLGGFQCTNFNERAIGTGNNVSYIYRGGLLLGGSVNRGSTVYTYVRTYMYVGRFLKSLRKKFQDKLAEANNVAEETISNIRTVRSFSNESKMNRFYERDINKSYRLGRTLGILIGITCM